MTNRSWTKDKDRDCNPKCNKECLNNKNSTIAMNIKTGTKIVWNSYWVNCAVALSTIIPILIFLIEHKRMIKEIAATPKDIPEIA